MQINVIDNKIPSLINKAVQKHQLGKLAEAESIYRQILQIQSNGGEEKVSSGNGYYLTAITNLGIILQQKGELEAAVDYYRQALSLNPDWPQTHYHLAKALQQQGQLEAAVDSYQQVISLKPDAAVYNNLGIIFQQQGELEAAIDSYRQAIGLKPELAQAHYNLGNVLGAQGELNAAVESYQQALSLKPDWDQVHYNLGNVLQQQGQLDEAVESYQQALRLNPDCAQAHYNLGNVLQDQGQLNAAVESYQQAISLQPDAAVYNNLGNALKQQGHLEAARECYQQAISLQPDLAQAHYNLGNVLGAQGHLEAAVESYQQAISLQPDFAHAKFNICMSQLPIIYSSCEEIQLKRNQYQQHLQKLVQSYQLASQKEREKMAEAVGSSQPFFLAYQGLNDRDLQQTYGEMICQLMSSCYPQWSQSMPIPSLGANEKIRVGFVSGFFRYHSNWKIPIKGWIENLDRNKFELFGYHTNSKEDQCTARATEAFVKFIQGPLTVEKWCEAIAQDKLHVMIFPELGMDPITVKLACLKLAPIQMTSWGHPNTSGLPTIDYYLSSELMEPENAQEHYSEKLVRLPNLSIHYSPLEIQEKTISKADIGIKNEEIMFWCCQSLFKYLPQNDDVFPRIAREIAKSKFVFINHHESEQVTEVFRQRLSRAFKEFELNYQDHCIFLPHLDKITFAKTAAMADVFLDSIAWSGCNSSLEAINYDIPIVTWPGDLMRGRHTLAILKMMGVEETIASSKDEYVKIAVRLGQDSQYRQYISGQVAENKHKLYGDMEPIRALENFLMKIVQKEVRQEFKNEDNLTQNSANYVKRTAVEIDSSEFDLKNNTPSNENLIRYLILSSNRTGSNLLCRQLINAGLGVPNEYFNEMHIEIISKRVGIPKNDMDRYIDFLLNARVTRNGIFGIKIQPHDYINYINPIENKIINSATKYIYLYRSNLLKQAISLHISTITGKWSFNEEVTLKHKSDIAMGDIEHVKQCLKNVIIKNQLLIRLIRQKSINPLVIKYEDYVVNQEKWLVRIADYLGVSDYELVAPEPKINSNYNQELRTKIFDNFIAKYGNVNLFGVKDILNWNWNPVQESLSLPVKNKDRINLNVLLRESKSRQINRNQGPQTKASSPRGYYSLINHSHKFIFFWNAKCGCSTLKKIFYEITEGDFYSGDNIHGFMGYLNSHKYFVPKENLENYSHYKKIIVVRDPWSRLVSFYTNKTLSVKKESNIDIYGIFDSQNYSFNELVQIMFTMKPELFQHHLELQSSGIEDIEFDHVILLSEMSQKLPSILQSLGIDIGRLRSLSSLSNSTSYDLSFTEKVMHLKPQEFNNFNRLPSFHCFYNQTLIDMVAKIYEGDILKFNLSYPEKERRVGRATVSEALKQAVEHHRAHRLAPAMEVYHQILAQQPQHPEALYGLGVLAQQKGQYQMAEKFLKTLLGVQPESVKGWFSLGNLRQVQGQLPEAVEAYQQALAIEPDSVAVHNNLGYTLQLQGQWEEAVTCYQKALKLQPDCPEAEVNLANALHAQGLLSPEKQAYYAGVNYDLGLASKKAGDLKTAIAYYRQAIAMKPDLVDAHDNLGVALQEQGEL